MKVELWTGVGSVQPAGSRSVQEARPRDVRDRSRQAEDDGWDGLKMYDTQCLHPDSNVVLAAAATATSRLLLSTATANPVTRHPSVAASAAAAIAELAPGRVQFGVGRGDSALAFIGGAPASVALFERYVSAVRRYLHGEAVPHADVAPWRITGDVSAMPLAHAPEASELRWLDPGVPAVSIDIYATGPRALGVGGRLGDRVWLGVLGDVARLKWAMEVARQARAAAGLDPATLTFGAHVPICVTDDLDLGRRRVSGVVASLSRFSVMSGTPVGPISSEAQRRVFAGIGHAYDMNQHAGQGPQVRQLTDAFIDAQAIVGPPRRCAERIIELAEVGLDAVQLAVPRQGTEAEYRALVDQAMPAVRAA